MAAQCPKRSESITKANLENVLIRAHPQDWSGLAYTCPHCGSIIGIQIDPVALKDDVVAQVSAVSQQVRGLAAGISALLNRLDRAKTP